MRRGQNAVLTSLIAIILAACDFLATPTPTPTPAPTPSPVATPPAATTSPAPTDSQPPSPTATPEPALSLDLPEVSDPRVVAVSVQSDVGTEGGEINVSVTSAADERIDELVLRWPTELNEFLVLAPFVPSEERIRDGGPPLVQEWTKWVIGPGEQGEPDGTISLGYGPLLAGATLNIGLNVRRVAAGPVAFDLQVLARNDLLTLDGGEPAELRVEIP
ncbi:MAG: hypothetical protein H0W98_04690 [Chloroflexi bacterium]|nr:hypothetical protein [Chloroflexota bacterium]MBA3740429.1 hypothetical protein [Chloroflexota bacterium]